MVEKIIVNPESIRGYGNIITPKTASDFTSSSIDYKVVKTTDTVYGTETTVYGIESAYTVSFDSASYTTSTESLNLQVTVLKSTAPVYNATVTVTGGGGSGTATTNILGVAYITVTGITESGTLTATYKNAKATAPVTYEQASYSLAFSQDTYTYDFMDPAVTVSCTLKNGNTPLSGETITFTYQGSLGHISFTKVTDSNGITSFTIYGDEMAAPTLTATYHGVTTTCTIEEGL